MQKILHNEIKIKHPLQIEITKNKMMKCFIHGSNRNFNNGENIVYQKDLIGGRSIQLFKK